MLPLVDTGPYFQFALGFKVVSQGSAEGICLMCELIDDFYRNFVDQWNELYPQQSIEKFDDIDTLAQEIDGHTCSWLAKAIRDEISYGESTYKLGGYPDFFQGDPRVCVGAGDTLKNYTVNLLTFDYSLWEEGAQKVEISWGDGSANWLITPEQYAARDFSQVLFEWAC